ncbi:MAG TPA: DNA polymerase IV [Nitrososphaerales archaeon]|nr:DNA polymerase IV [Nitrososphaerales archaeon]
MSQSGWRAIFHVDLDAFYVSVEVKDNPSLKGLPVVVGADPEGGKARGVVMTSSYEARKFGLKSGMPISIAYRLCPNAVYLPPRWERYGEISMQVMDLLRRRADKFEQTGIDEAFLDVSDRATSLEQAQDLARAIKKDIRDSLGITCSIGVAPNKSLAKIASDRQKPDGLTVVPFDDPKGFLAPLPVAVIPGVGSKTQAFLKEKGIATIGELQKVSGQELLKWFGKTGVWLWGVIQAEERLSVFERDMLKSMSVERTFGEDVEDFDRVYAQIDIEARELAERVRDADLKFKVTGIKIRFKGFQTFTREVTLTGYTDSEEALRHQARILLKEFETKKRPVRLVGVRVSQLKREKAELTRLDEWAE